jgi:hypothetical protein
MPWAVLEVADTVWRVDGMPNLDVLRTLEELESLVDMRVNM